MRRISRTAFVRRTIWEGLGGAAEMGRGPGTRVAYSDSKEGGAAQPLKEALPLAQQIHHIQHALCHVHQLQALVRMAVLRSFS